MTAVLLLTAAVAAACSNTATGVKPPTSASGTSSKAGPTAQPQEATPAGPPEPQTWSGVKAAADRIDAAGAAGDGGTEWDMLTAAAQAAMSRSDYAKVVAGCPGMVRTATWSIYVNPTATSASVEVRVGDANSHTFTWETLTYENGHWRRSLSAGELAWMRRGVASVLADLRRNGAC